jgi:hypothetical protein
MLTAKERLLDFLRVELTPQPGAGSMGSHPGYLLKLKRGEISGTDVDEFLNLLRDCPEVADLNEDAELIRRLFFAARMAPMYWGGLAGRNPRVFEKLVHCQRECGRIVGEQFSKYGEM